MNRIIQKKWVTAVLFLVILFAGAAFNWFHERPALREYLVTTKAVPQSLGNYISGFESQINSNVDFRYDFINAYGYIQTVLGKYEENNFEVVKDENGKLYYTYFPDGIKDTAEYVERCVRLKNSIKSKKTRLLYVMPPDKYVEGYTKFPLGIPYNLVNETADAFLKNLNRAGIDSIDFKNYLSESRIAPQDLFYTTDHHWKIKTAFWAADQFFQILQGRYGAQIPNEDLYSNLKNYNVITYPKSFLGSMGRKTGIYYAGVDDFDLIYPQFDTSFVYENSSLEKGLNLTGRFEEALLATPVLRNNASPFDKDLYMLYLYGNPAFAHIKNNKNPNGLKICIIKDSYAVPFAAFASLRCSDIYMLDPRFYQGNMEDFINSTKLDYVLIMYAPDNLADEFFPFGK